MRNFVMKLFILQKLWGKFTLDAVDSDVEDTETVDSEGLTNDECPNLEG